MATAFGEAFRPIDCQSSSSGEICTAPSCARTGSACAEESRRRQSSPSKKSPGFITRGFLCFGARAGAAAPTLRPANYAAFASVVTGDVGVEAAVVEAGIVASIGTTFPFPIRLADFHAAKIFALFAAALFT